MGSEPRAPSFGAKSRQARPPPRGIGRRRSLLLVSTVPSVFVALRQKAAWASIPLRTEDLGSGFAAGRRRARDASPAASPSPGSEGALESFLEARALAASGDYAGAFSKYDAAVQAAPDRSTVSSYARLGRAITRYEVEDKADRAVIELEYEVLKKILVL